MDPIANARDEIDKPDFLIKKKTKKMEKTHKTNRKKNEMVIFCF